MVGTGGEAQPFHGQFQGVGILPGEGRMLTHHGGAQLLVQVTLACLLALTCRQYPRLYRGRAFTGTAAVQHLRRQRRYFDMQVYAVQQGAGQAAAVARHLVAGAAAACRAVAQIAARAGIHGGDELEAGGKADLVGGAGNHHMARFQGLAQDLEHLAVKFGQLIQEQYAMVGQGDLARARVGTACKS